MQGYAKDRVVFTWCDAELADWIEQSLAGLPVEIYRADHASALYAIPYFIAVVDGRRLAGLTAVELDTWSCMRLNNPAAHDECPRCGGQTGQIHFPLPDDPPHVRRLFMRPEYTPPVLLVNPQAMREQVTGLEAREWPSQLTPDPLAAWFRAEVESAQRAVMSWRVGHDEADRRAEAEEAAEESSWKTDESWPEDMPEWMTEKFNRRLVMLLTDSVCELPQRVTDTEP